MLKDRLRQLRESRGLSQKELAARLGLASGTIGGYENGSRLPKPRILAELAEFFGVTPEYLRTGVQLTPDQYAAFVEKVTDALDNTSSEDLEAVEVDERTVRAALKQRQPISQDRAEELAHALGVNIDAIITMKDESGSLRDALVEAAKDATSDQLRRLLKYYELIRDGEL